MEQLATPHVSYFYTWTYDDQNIPKTENGLHTLRKKPFQKWLNRQSQRHNFRYYCVGEYGDDTVRPHYHAAVFPQVPLDPGVLLKPWTKGRIKSVRDLIPTRARYLAQYTAKKLTKDTDKRLRDGQEPEFRSSSRTPGLAAPFLPALVSAYSTEAGKRLIATRGDVESTIRIHGKIYPLGKFMLGKLRKELGIPELHRDRLQHEGYELRDLHRGEFAERDPRKSLCRKMKHDAKERQTKLRKQAPRV